MKQSFFALLFLIMCCYSATLRAQKNTSPNFLFISDVHLNPAAQQTNYGDDAGMDVWNAFKKKVSAVMSAKNAPDFVLYTGDLPVHTSVWCQALSGSAVAIHDTAMKMVLNELRDLSVTYNKPVFYLPGNNDALAGDYLNFTNAAGQSALSLVTPAPLFFPSNNDTQKSATKPYILSQNRQSGYYDAQIMPGLRLIALNTVPFNIGCPGNGDSAACAAEMRWLRSRLADAANSKEKVYIAMHIPPGGTYNGQQMWNTNGGVWIDTFLQLTATYSAGIAGVFYAHTHMDELRRLRAPDSDTVTKIAICCPGISAQHRNNPGFKIVYYDKKSKEPVDFTTLYTPVPLNGNHWPDSSYSFKATFKYGPTGSIYDCLKNEYADTIANKLAIIYQVKSGQSSLAANAATIMHFIDVRAQQ